MKKLNKFYVFISLCVITIMAGPVGVANIVLGFILGDAPCTSCWSLRLNMIVVALAGLFILRYGPRIKYIAFIMLVAAYGLWNAFWHLGWYAQNDIGQGQALMIFNIHTQMWAAIVYWGVIVLLGLILIIFGPNAQDYLEEFEYRKNEDLSKLGKWAFIVFFVITTTNAIQALIAVGPPPYTGVDSPARFTFNPKYNKWETLLPNMFADPSLRGAMGVSKPDLPEQKAEYLTFENSFEKSPLSINKNLSISSKKELSLDLNSAVNGMRLNKKDNSFALVTQDYGLYLTNKDLSKVNEHLVLDSFYFPVILNPIGVDFMAEGSIKIMGYNKAYTVVKQDDKADEIAGFAHFKEGANKFSALDRNMFRTVRSNTNYVSSFVSDEKYSYLITVPSNLNKNFVVIKQSNEDGVLSAEFTPSISSNIELKKDRELGELYTTALAYKENKLYAASKNFNTIVEIDLNTQQISDTYSFPSEIKNIRAMDFVGDDLYMISYEDNKNILYILK